MVLTSKVARQSSSGHSSPEAFLLMPALLTAMCRPPRPFTVSSTILHTQGWVVSTLISQAGWNMSGLRSGSIKLDCRQLVHYAEAVMQYC